MTVGHGFRLAQAGPGEHVEIIALDGGSNVHRRLNDLGLAPGKRVTVVSSHPGGPMLIALGGSRIGIGFGMALKVKVRLVVEGDIAE